jgi:hypothetical protein
MPHLYAVLMPRRSKTTTTQKPTPRLGTVVKAGIIAALLSAARVATPRANATNASHRRTGFVFDSASVNDLQKLHLKNPHRNGAILAGLSHVRPNTRHQTYIMKNLAHQYKRGKGKHLYRPFLNRSKVLARQLANGAGRVETPYSPNTARHAETEFLARANRLATRTTADLSSELAAIYHKIALCKSTQVFADDGEVHAGNYFFGQGWTNFLIDAERVARAGRLHGTFKGDAHSQMNPYVEQCGMKHKNGATLQELANHVRKVGKERTHLAMTEAVMDLNENDILGLLVDIDALVTRSKGGDERAWNVIRVVIGRTNGVARKFGKKNPLRNIYILDPATNKLLLIRDKAHFFAKFKARLEKN